jgi:uncharacterized membrane protein
MLLNYLYIFILFSFLGWLFEYLAFNKDGHHDLLELIFGVHLPLLSLYGLMACGLYFINTFNISLIYKMLIALVFINSFECTAGLISESIFKKQTWKYDGGVCNGYVSLPTAIFWSVLSLIFFIIFQNV